MRLASQTAEQQAPLFFRRSRPAGPSPAAAEARAPLGESSRVAYAGVFLFTLVLYFRPNELLPGVFGTLPIAKTIAIVALLAYLASRLSKTGPLTILPIETKMVALIAGLGVLFLPIAVVPQHSIDTLTEVFLKVGVIYVLMTNVIDTRYRLDLMWKLVVVAGTYLAYGAIRTYSAGQFTLTVRGVGVRIEGIVGGIFGNPNDLATALDMLLPLAIALALTHRGFQRTVYWVCAAALAAAVFVTFSRGGFLGLVAMGAVLLWKLGRGRRGTSIAAAVVLSGVFLVAAPGNYSERVLSIFNIQSDNTGSATERRELLERGIALYMAHPIIGVGMGNFPVYSHREIVAHNGYIEIAAELGTAGLLAYLVLLFAPIRSLLRIERRAIERAEAAAQGGPPRFDYLYYYSVALQGGFAAYMVCSFFGSIQYQWYIYYMVAYAIALRRIDASSEPAAAAAETAAPATGFKGVLWRAGAAPALRQPRASLGGR